MIQAELGRDIALSCDYDLEEEEEVLYSIKWYRADKAGQHGNNYSRLIFIFWPRVQSWRELVKMNYFYFDPQWFRSSTDIYLEVKRPTVVRLIDNSDGSHIPGSQPITTYFVRGVRVSESSSPTLLIIKNVSAETSGVFKCEVSGGPPR